MYYSSETHTEGRMSGFLQEQRIRASLPYLQGRVLDFGCGNGALARYVDEANYVGLDINPLAVRIAQQRFPDHTFLENNFFVDTPEKFDAVAVLAVIEHLQKPVKWLTWFREQLKPRGLLVITTPHPHYRKVHEFGAKVGIFSRAAAQDHESFIDGSMMRNYALDAGFHLLKESYFLGRANQLFVLEIS